MSLLPFKNTPNNLFSFAGSVGRFGDNNRDDVIKAQALLANAGYYDLPDPGMPTGWPGGELNRALIRFQKDHGLEADGTLLPLDPSGVTETGVGETVQALQDELGDRLKGLAAPDVQEADDFYRLRPMLDGDGELKTDVRLRGDDSTGEYVGLKPVASDVPPDDYELRPGQQEARAGGPSIRPTQPRQQPAQPPVRPSPLAPQQPRTIPQEQYGPYLPIPRDRIPDESLPQRPIIPQPQIPPAENGTGPSGKLPPIENKPNAPGLGRIIIAEDGKELYVPPLGAWAKDLSPEDRQLADILNESLAIELDGLHTGGSRGNRQTQEGVNIAIQECLKELKAVLPEATITHEFGGNYEGNVGQEAKKEEHLWHYDEAGNQVRSGSNRTDISILIARNIAEMLRGNTYDSKGGKPDERESNAESNTRGKTPDEELVMIEKQRPGRSEEQLRQDARDVCRAAAGRIRAKWDRQGEFAKPAPKEPAQYPGPENAHRAKKLRELREKQ